MLNSHAFNVPSLIPHRHPHHAPSHKSGFTTRAKITASTRAPHRVQRGCEEACGRHDLRQAAC